VTPLTTTSPARDRPAADARAAVRALLREGAITSVHQPIHGLGDDSVLGYEALARMRSVAGRGPAEWLALAEQEGVRAELEIACLRAAVAGGLPPGGALLFVNLSASLLADERVRELLAPLAHRIVIELSEQERVDDYDRLTLDLERWHDAGARIAVDDTGSGYASLRHVLRVEPAFIKLDQSLIHGIDGDRVQRALIASVVAFAAESGAAVIAEGVETHEQLVVLRNAGVDFAQGYLLGRPQPGWRREVRPRERLDVDRCRSIGEVGDVVCGHLFELGVMPSMYLERQGLLRCVAHRGVWQVLDGLAPGRGITGRAFSEGRLVLVDDVSASGDYLEAIPAVVAEACVPLFAGGRPVGALNIDSRRPLTDVDVAELRRAAAVVSRWLESGGLDHRTDAVAHLAHAAVRLERADTVASVTDILLDAALEISGMPNAMAIGAGALGGAPTVVARGPQRQALLRADAAELAALAEVVVPSRSCYSAGDEQAVGMVGTDELRRVGMRSVVVVPVRPSVGPATLLAVTSPRGRHLHTDTIELLELLAAQATARLDTLAHMSELRRQAMEDPLTGIGNRGAFNASLDRWLEDGTAGTLALIDVDHFKAVNDTLGHLEGDRVLRDLARLLRSTLRPEDRVFRIGGDEFAVLLPRLSPVDAGPVAERLQLAASVSLASVGAGVSIGLSAMPDGGSAETALHEADHRLYEAKRRRTVTG